LIAMRLNVRTVLALALLTCEGLWKAMMTAPCGLRSVMLNATFPPSVHTRRGVKFLPPRVAMVSLDVARLVGDFYDGKPGNGRYEPIQDAQTEA
jgi:hypothetical protein